MAATETSEILQAIREMEAEERKEAAELLGPHMPEPEFSRRQFGGILAAVAGGSLSVQAAMAAINEGVMPAQAADGVVSDIDTLQSGDGSAIDVVNDLLPSTASGAALGSSSFPWSAITTGQVDNDDYHEKVVTQSGSTGSLDLSAANVFEQTVTGNITFSFNNPEATPPGNSFLLIVIQDGTGGHTLSWPAAVEWGGGSAPGVSTAANDKHIFSFQSPDGGTTWYGFLAAENVA